MIPNNIKNEDLDNLKSILNYLKQLSDDGVSPLIEKQILFLLDNLVPFFSNLVMTGIFPEIHRLTINERVLGENKRIRDFKYLKYPPANKVSYYGRCNYPQQSILYSSMFHVTTINEIQPRVGDLMTASIWRVKNNQTLTYCPIFKNQPKGDNIINPRLLDFNKIYNEKLKDHPENIREHIDSLVQFITEVFTKRIDAKNHIDYIFSAYFSNKIFNDFENGAIEAIYYPSVKDGLSFENLAIKPDAFESKYELIEVQDSVCINVPTAGKGGHFSQVLSKCKNFDYVSEKILWDSNQIYQTPQGLSHLISQYKINISE